MTEYLVNDTPLAAPLELLDVQSVIDNTTHPWVNHTLSQVDDVVVRLGVLHGEYHWHQHNDEDEFFFVLDGRMVIELEGHDPVELTPRQAFTVPKTLPHRPICPERTTVLMIEKSTVKPQGN
jgi:mannose-6-phosphate isomerase-like protein (cupin superfamily)